MTTVNPPPPVLPAPPIATPAVEVTHVTHMFKKHKALNDISFTLQRGLIHGFVGPNGAGKTTMLRIIATLLSPQAGQVRVLGHDVVAGRKLVRRRIGFMPDHFSMYRQMTVHEYLDFFAAAYGIPADRRATLLNDVLALTDMDGRRHDLIKTLSRGMQQRVSLARVLVNDPELLLLDEPASGLDPRARIELMAILQELRRLGKTIFISSHILTELATLCDAVTIIDRGQVRYTGSMAGLLAQDNQHETSYMLTLAQEQPELGAALQALPGIIAVDKPDGQGHYVIRFDPAQADTGVILRAALERGAVISAFRPTEKQLNQAFMDLTEPGVRP